MSARTIRLLPLLLAPLAACDDPSTPLPLPEMVPQSQVYVAVEPPPAPGDFRVVKSRAMTWSDALAAATSVTVRKQTYPSHLASAGTIEQAMAVFTAMKQGQECWIGAHQDEGATQPDLGWRWMDGEAWSYNAFNLNEPNDRDGVENGEENAVAAHHFRWGVGWDDLPETTRLDCYVVEIDSLP